MENNKAKYTEKDLENLIIVFIDSHVECEIVPSFCRLVSTTAGRDKAIKKIKRLILNEGIKNIDSAIAQIESQLTMGDD